MSAEISSVQPYHYNLDGKRVFVAGHNGMVGSALCRGLQGKGCDIITASRKDADLTQQTQTQDFMSRIKPDVVIISAAKVGGILANQSYPVDFLYDNMMIASHLIHASHRCDVERVVFLGSSCIYPKMAPQPITEDALLTGPLEPTNEWYAIAKIAGIKLIQAYRQQYGRAYISAMPTNLYGPGDNFDLMSSHVVPALIRKIHKAKQDKADSIELWGTGKPRREFLHVDDCAEAILYLTQNYDGDSHVNMGCGQDIEILALAQQLCHIIGFEGEISHDLTKPDGTPRKLLSTKLINELGWSPNISLSEGLSQTYAWYLKHIEAQN